MYIEELKAVKLIICQGTFSLTRLYRHISYIHMHNPHTAMYVYHIHMYINVYMNIYARINFSRFKVIQMPAHNSNLFMFVNVD